MMVKAFLAWAGLMAIRAPVHRVDHHPCEAAHEAANREQAIFSGAQAVARRFHRLSDVMESDPSNIPRVNKGIDDMRTLMAEVARRAER